MGVCRRQNLLLNTKVFKYSTFKPIKTVHQKWGCEPYGKKASEKVKIV